jgi:hypothetical protein
MSTEVKLKQQREKQKLKNIKNKHSIAKKVELKQKTRKISEKYLKEEIQIEKILKERNENRQPIEDEYARKKKSEIDFFCDPFSSVPLNIEKAANKTDTEDIDDDDEDDDDDDERKEISHKSEHSNQSSPNTHMASTYIGQDYESLIGKFELTRITFDEVKLLFYPNGDHVKHTIDDVENNLRNILEEGLYIGEQPSIGKISNKHRLVNRLHESNAMEFIDSNGDLKNFEKLVDDDVYRLHSDCKFTPIYVPLMPMNFESTDKVIKARKFLKIFISNLIFDQHRKFTNEHHIAMNVEKLFNEYERRMKFDIVGTLQNKLSNLRELKAESFPANPQRATKASNEEILLNMQIKNTRTKLHAERDYDHKVLKGLLENYKNLKEIRQKQNHAITNLTLKIHKHEKDVNLMQSERQQQYDAELNEMIAEEFEKYYIAKHKYKEFLKLTADPDAIAEETILKKPKKPDIDKIEIELNEIYKKIPFDDADLTILLSHDGEASRPKDKMRKLNRISYRIELEVDGEIVGSTKHCRLDAEFSIPIQSAFILKLTKHLPEKIKLLVSMQLNFF